MLALIALIRNPGKAALYAKVPSLRMSRRLSRSFSEGLSAYLSCIDLLALLACSKLVSGDDESSFSPLSSSAASPALINKASSLPPDKESSENLS
jgi:hypothetical protein